MTLVFDPVYTHILKLKEMTSNQDVPEEIKAEVDKIHALFEARDNYCRRVTSDSSSALGNIIKRTIECPWDKLYKEGKTEIKLGPYMVSGNLEAQFLKSIVSIAKAKKVLELGLFTGCGALTIAEAIPEDGEVYSCELIQYVADLAREFLNASPHGRKVNILNGPAKDTLVELGKQNMKFDIIFMDADKINYLAYYKLIFEKELLASGGTIVVDNAMFYGIPYSYEKLPQEQGGIAVREFNEYLLNDQNIHRVLLPLRDGVLLIRRKEDI